MKRLLIVGLLIFAVLGCYAQEIKYLTEADLEWDAVTELADSTPIDPLDVLTYEVYYTDDLAGYTGQTYVGETGALLLHVFIPAGGPYTYGVRAKLVTDGGVTTLYSAINWSNVNGLATPDPFLYRLPSAILPKLPMGLRTQ